MKFVTGVFVYSRDSLSRLGYLIVLRTLGLIAYPWTSWVSERLYGLEETLKPTKETA